jgi:hypothetical protein
MKGFLESSSAAQFDCVTHLSHYQSVVGYQCSGCQAAIDLVRNRSADLNKDCSERGGTRSIDKNKIRYALSGVYDSFGLMPP